MQSQKTRGTVLTLAGGSLWGLNGTVVSILMGKYGVDPLWLACVRELGACWLFFAVAAVRTPQKLRGLAHSPKSLLGVFWVALGAILFSQVAYLEAIDWSNPATATVLQSLSILLVMIYVCFFNRRLPRHREVAGIMLALVGTFLIATGGNPAELTLPPEALLWGFGCALAAMFLTVLPLKLIDSWGNFAVNGFAFLMAGVLLLVTTQPWCRMPTLDTVGWLLVLFSLTVGSFGAYALFLEGVNEAGSMRGAMLSTAEPLVATLSSVLLLGIVFTPVDLAGFAMIIVMVFLTA